MLQKVRDLWSLIKCKQTFLLLFTGLVGYASGLKGGGGPALYGGLLGSLFLAISGTTVLNMVYDRDIDAVMPRTRHRPLAAGRLRPWEAVLLGGAMSAAGLGWALALDLRYGLVVLAGWLLDLVVYTVWLKRRTPWSVIWGGLSGGMPVLAGRALATGQVEVIGLLLALAVLLWIPTHIMTFSIKYAADYAAAGVPVFPNVYGLRTTQVAISLSTVLAAAVMTGVTWQLAEHLGAVAVASALAMVLVGLGANALIRPSVQVNLRLFKFASVYMVSAMALMLL
ncbi:protoheme IX farnesyltransferase [Symbiobacterium terraclitae]|uniref:Protoheme IX farnesyltransferase n=1 Tax=Symbiobacterium terraclitae TaxID=557451 RepID=A0ABS4JP17_9FIRM|nr:UbiA family prenyltransferase [Symbiobacterium terraclitae]MBP2017293.1 protoheme IX farnesyltransferase [Symbiobacterium terraclitae]